MRINIKKEEIWNKENEAITLEIFRLKKQKKEAEIDDLANFDTRNQL